MKQLFHHWVVWLVGLLLHHANRYPGHGKTKEIFYSLKDRLLRQYAVADGHDLQVLPAKFCYSCKGTGVDQESDDDEDCYDCNGTGEYLSRAFVPLGRFKLGRFVFHQPVGRFTDKSLPAEFEALKDKPNPIMGVLKKQKTVSSHEARLWLFLLFERHHLGLIVKEVPGWGKVPFGLLATPVYWYRWFGITVHRLGHKSFYRGLVPTISFRIKWRSPQKPEFYPEPTDDLPF